MDEREKKIIAYRQKIDDIDAKIVKLLNSRAKYADSIGRIKRSMNLPVYVPSREEDVIANVQAQNPGPLSDEAVRRLYERIIDESRRLEKENYETGKREKQKK
ncbi:MAG: chorismate mutase [Calditrichaceae bacterium]|nr:chorismate mutase [Calditrichaceae bacterium]MBN2708815.1 chorismate mutase [Calditrichaceae bacterium]RQV97656.1 MAG: chorismate mutase [Calditrichota bacterium]